ncbi:MAG: response regulator [Desulfobacteraceae bacterium]|nr:response regulator [Desulfobacteraceae bacterium]
MKNKLLLVDDEEGIRKVLSISLADRGYEVYTAENGEEALKIFRDTNPPIILTDIKMPGMDGLELLQKIKEENPETEVIMITGHGDMELAIKSLKYDAVDFVSKPINDDILEIAINRAREKIVTRNKLRQYTENLETLVKEKSAKLVELERQVAVGQAIEGLSSVMKDIADGFEGGLKYFNDMPCYVSLHSREMKVVAANRLYRDRLGGKLGDNSWALYKGEHAEPHACPVGKTFESGKGHRIKTAFACPSEKTVPVIVHTAPIRNQEGRVELVVEISADIIEIKSIQDELRSTQRKYQQLFDEVPCYITVLDRDLRLTATNKLFKEDFGDETFSHCYKTYKRRDEPCHDCPVAKTFQDGKSHQAEMVVTSKSGNQYNVLIRTAPLWNSGGEVAEVMEMSTNITQIRQLQDHLSALGLKIGSISHSIKGLLTGLDGGMYLVDTGFKTQDREKIKDGWEAVKLVSGRIRKLVLDILYFAKERDLKWERTDILDFAKDVVMTIEPRAKKQGIQMVYDFDPGLGEFEIDPGVVSSAIINILENAADACLENVSEKEPRIIFSIKQEKDWIVFEVADNGVGMNTETKENLFSLFFSSKGHKGTGLGLFIANKIIEQHGGRITVDSEIGRGAHFYIRIPAELPESLKTGKKMGN